MIKTMAIIIIRTVIVYFSLLITMRLLGKRQLGEMELSEFILAALIADLASLPLQDLGMPMINGLVPIMVPVSYTNLDVYKRQAPGLPKS